MEKYENMEQVVLVYTVTGKYDDVDCVHNYVAIFPNDATKDEIDHAVGDTWERIGIHSYVSAQKRVFTRVV